jgi:hypothetical protein
MNNQNQVQLNTTSATHGYTTSAGDERDSAKVILLGGVAAGVVSGLLVLLTEKDKQQPQTRVEQARHAIEVAAARARAEGEKTKSDVTSSLSGIRGDTTKNGKKARKNARKRGSGLSKKAQKDADDTMARITAMLAAARAEAKGTYEDVQKQAPDVNELAKQLRSRKDVVASDARDRGRKLREHAVKDADKARGEASSLVSTLKTKALDAEKVAESYVESALLPRLKELEKEAANMVEAGVDRTKTKSQELRTQAEKDLIPHAREKAQQLRKQAEKDLIPQAREKAEQLRKRAEEDVVPHTRESVDKLKVTLGEGAHVAAGNLEKVSADSAKKLAFAKEQAEKQAKDAGESVKRGSRETRSLLFWLGLAGAIVYNVFLNEDQQHKVKELGMELFGEAKEMYTDIKGSNDSLSA